MATARRTREMAAIAIAVVVLIAPAREVSSRGGRSAEPSARTVTIHSIDEDRLPSETVTFRV